jgi:hypothetical protein
MYRPDVDVLAQVLESLRLRGSVYCRSTLATAWRLRFEAHPCAVFHVIEHGAATLEFEDKSTLALEAGDFVLCPRGQAHWLSDPRSNVGARVPRIRMRDADPYRDEVWCSSTPDAVLLCGTFTLAPSASHAILRLLPEVVHIPRQVWLERITELMRLEVQDARPGVETVLRRLAETLFVHVLRHHLEHAKHVNGWLGDRASRASPGRSR